MFLVVGMPSRLGSYAGAVLVMVPIVMLVLRILSEERFLECELRGHDAYTKRVRFRLIPGLW